MNEINKQESLLTESNTQFVNLDEISKQESLLIAIKGDEFLKNSIFYFFAN